MIFGIDFEKELARLEKERGHWESEIKRAQGKLNNAGFTAKAPEKIIEGEREKLKNAEQMLEKIVKRIDEMKG